MTADCRGTSRPADILSGQTWIDTDTPSGTVWSLYIYDGSHDIKLGLRWTSGMGWVGVDAIARTNSCTGCDMHAAFGLAASIGYHADGFYPFSIGVLLELLVAAASYA